MFKIRTLLSNYICIYSLHGVLYYVPIYLVVHAFKLRHLWHDIKHPQIRRGSIYLIVVFNMNEIFVKKNSAFRSGSLF